MEFTIMINTLYKKFEGKQHGNAQKRDARKAVWVWMQNFSESLTHNRTPLRVPCVFPSCYAVFIFFKVQQVMLFLLWLIMWYFVLLATEVVMWHVEIFFPSTMSVQRKLKFTDLCINGHLLGLISEGAVNECEVYQLLGRLVETFPKISSMSTFNPQPMARF
jgi:hypothetical protein